MAHDPLRWWPLMYEGLHTRHYECGGFIYYRCDEYGNVRGPTMCDKCHPGFREEQLNLLDWNVNGSDT